MKILSWVKMKLILSIYILVLFMFGFALCIQALTKRETELNKKEQELLEFQAKLASRESVCSLCIIYCSFGLVSFFICDIFLFCLMETVG